MKEREENPKVFLFVVFCDASVIFVIFVVYRLLWQSGATVNECSRP